MLDTLCKSGLFVHTARAQERCRMATLEPQNRPLMAPRVALDMMMLPVNVVLGTKACNLTQSKARLRHGLEGPLRPAEVGALGLINRGVTWAIFETGHGMGKIAGQAARPLAYALRQNADAWAGRCAAHGAFLGAAVGMFIGIGLEWIRAAARWAITHPHLVAFIIVGCAVLLAAMGLAEKGLVHAGLPQNLSQFMANMFVMRVGTRVAAEDKEAVIMPKQDEFSELAVPGDVAPL